MTKISALRAIVRDFKMFHFDSIALLKNTHDVPKYGDHSICSTNACVKYQLQYNPEEVIRVYIRVGSELRSFRPILGKRKGKVVFLKLTAVPKAKRRQLAISK